jgi:hypothetical protein
LWLYPGDHLVLPFPADRLAGFYDGANKLELEVEAPVHVEGDFLDVRLFVEDEEVLQYDLPAPVARRRIKEFFLDPALDPRVQDVRMEIVNPSPNAYWLLLMSTLSEEYDYGFNPAVPEVEIIELDEGMDEFGEDGDDPFEVTEPELAAESDPFATLPRRFLPPDRIERVGDVPAPPGVRAVEEAREGVVEGKVFALWPVSNSVLEKAGLGWWSPVEVLEGGQPLKAASDRKVFRGDCPSCFLHFGQSIIARPAGDGTDLEVRLSPDMPVTTPSGRHVHWVYPGTSARYTRDVAWKGSTMWVRARISTHTLEKNKKWSPPMLRVAGQQMAFERQGAAESTLWEARLEVARTGAGPWQVEIVTESGGPYLIVHELEVADAREVQTWVEPPSAAKAGGKSP